MAPFHDPASGLVPGLVALGGGLLFALLDVRPIVARQGCLAGRVTLVSGIGAQALRLPFARLRPLAYQSVRCCRASLMHVAPLRQRQRTPRAPLTLLCAHFFPLLFSPTHSPPESFPHSPSMLCQFQHTFHLSYSQPPAISSENLPTASVKRLHRTRTALLLTRLPLTALQHKTITKTSPTQHCPSPPASYSLTPPTSATTSIYSTHSHTSTLSTIYNLPHLPHHTPTTCSRSTDL